MYKKHGKATATVTFMMWTIVLLRLVGLELSTVRTWVLLTILSIGINWIVDRLDGINKK